MSNTTTCAKCVKVSQDLARFTNLYRAIGDCPLKVYYADKRVSARKAQIEHAKVCTD
jgi:hypothetical protein